MPDTLARGSRGPDVAELQAQLIEVGYGEYLQPFGIDGIYGSKTEAAVREWQNSCGFNEAADVGSAVIVEGCQVEFSGGSLYASHDATAPSSYSNYFLATVTKIMPGAGNPFELKSLDEALSGVWAREAQVTYRLPRNVSAQTWHSLRDSLNVDPPTIAPAITVVKDPQKEAIKQQAIKAGAGIAGSVLSHILSDDENKGKFDPMSLLSASGVTDLLENFNPLSGIVSVSQVVNLAKLWKNRKDVKKKLPGPGHIKLFIYNPVTDNFIIIPTTPNEISDDVSVTYNTVTPRGRSVGYVGYEKTENRKVSFSVRVFGEFLRDSKYDGEANRLPEFVDKVKALEYPNYPPGDNPVDSPRCYVSMYKGIIFTGVCTSVSVTWGGPIKEDAYAYADISFSFMQVSDAALQAVEVETQTADCIPMPMRPEPPKNPLDDFVGPPAPELPVEPPELPEFAPPPELPSFSYP